MTAKNHVFIATSLDGYIADSQGGIEWLHRIPNPEGNDMGYQAFIESMDALVMGRNTFETVCSFPGDWPYSLPVFVCSTRLTRVPEAYQKHAQRVGGTVPDILQEVHAKGYQQLYIDGGNLIQQFLAADAIDCITQTIIPIVLGGGIPLFGNLPQPLAFRCTQSQRFLDAVVQNTYERVR